MKSKMTKDFDTKSRLRYMQGGKVHGPGGPTDDMVPAMLSAGEYVLPADTVKALGKENLDRLRKATHKPVKMMADGGYIDDEEFLRRSSQGLKAGTTPYAAPRSVPIGPTIPEPEVPFRSAPSTLEPPDPRVQAPSPREPGRFERLFKPSGQYAESPVVKGLKGAGSKLRTALPEIGSAAAKGGTRLLGPGAGVVLEGPEVATVVNDPEASKLDVASQVARSGSRLAAATAGGLAGTAVGGPVGAVIGGGLGYFAPDLVLNTIDAFTDADLRAPSAISNERGVPTPSRFPTAGASESPLATSGAAVPPVAGGDASASLDGYNRFDTPYGNVFERTTVADEEDPRLVREFTDGKNYNGLTVVPFSEGTAAIERANAIRGSALRGGEAPPVDERAEQINQSFNRAADQLKSAYAGKKNFQGRLARSLADLEEGRFKALDRRDVLETQRAGQDIDRATLAVRKAQLVSDAANSDRYFALQLEQFLSGKESSKRENLNSLFDATFQTADNKPDKQKQELFKDYLFRSDPRFKGMDRAEAEKTLYQLDPYEQARVVSDAKLSFELNQRTNEAQRRAGGRVSDRMDPIARREDVPARDIIFGGPQSRRDALRAHLPWNEGDRLVTDSGRAVLVEDAFDAGSATDAGLEYEADKQIKKRKLRREE